MLGNEISKKRQSVSTAEHHKRSKLSHYNDERRGAEEVLSDQQLDDSSYDDLSSSASGSPPQDELAKLAEVVKEFYINFDEVKGKNGKEHLQKVLKTEIALANTSGGIIKINSSRKLTIKEQDDLMPKLFGSECGENDPFGDIFDVKKMEEQGLTTCIFVRKSSEPIVTDESHLYQRKESGNSKVHPLYSSISKMLKKRERRCICTQEEKFKTFFHLNETMSNESMTKEYKLLNPSRGEKLPTGISNKLSDNIVSFANTRGGTIYFGVRDSDATIQGQRMEDDEEMADIYHSIVKCMERKLWALDSGEEHKPKENEDYHIRFFPVHGAEDNTFVIAVHICAFHGAAVFKKKPECSVLDEQNNFDNLGFKEWLDLHKLDSLGNENDRKKLNCQNIGRKVYYTVENSIDNIYSDLIEASPGELKIQPKGAMISIPNRGLTALINSLIKIFQQNEWNGIAFIERCWGVNIGLSLKKPSEVICDILVCSPSFPLLLVSLTEKEASRECCEYNRKLATTLKRMLAQDGGCIEKIYVKPITLSCSDVDDTCIKEIFDESSVYPFTYQMSERKYKAIIKALVPVLARVNISVKGAVGEHLFNLLTKEQYSILFEDMDSPKVKIAGPPGSGKSVLALERIRRLRMNEGFSSHQVLFVCSNKVLEAQVRSNKVITNGEEEPLCLVYNYFGFILSLMHERVNLDKVKHIVIDEGQHFKLKPHLRTSMIEDWWDKLMRCLYSRKNPPSLWVFCDFSQKILKEPCVLESLPDGFTNLYLRKVIRTTGKVHRFIQRFLEKNDPRIHLGHDFEGEDVDVLVPKTPSRFEVSRELHLVYMLISLLKDMVDKGVDPGTIGVLFTSEVEMNWYRKLFDKHTRRCRVRDGKTLSEGGSIVFDTIRIFSGDAKDTIIGFCPYFDYESAFQDNNALMVSLCSRAKLKLILILENEKVASSFKLDDCMEKTDVQWDKDAVVHFDMWKRN